ncbi:MAG: hypothetical protein AB7H97_06780, partial [Pseudobdellovibrionaceae bacterium]
TNGPFYCFIPAPKARASKLQFTFPSDGNDIGNVKYQKSASSIAIKRLKEIELAKAGDRTSEVRTEWVELPENPSSGKYITVSQGAVISSLEYQAAKGKSKTIKFI